MENTIYKLPDGSGCFTASLPLPKDHWLYADHDNIPPMPLRAGTDNGGVRGFLKSAIQEAARYAIRTATGNGKEQDFDPDAMVQNFVIGMLGYNTPSGLSSCPEFNPNPKPSILVSLQYSL